MLRAERGNKVITIQDEEKPYYLNKGYDIYTLEGEVVEKCVPNDLGTLRKAYIEHEDKIKELTDRIAELEAAVSGISTTPDAKAARQKAETNPEPKKSKAREA